MSPVHYIAPSAISITPNANGSHRDLAVYVAKGAKIKVLCPRAGIGYVKNEYQEWTLSGRNRRLADTTGTVPYTIYARLKKTGDKTGYLVFAPRSENGTDKYQYLTLADNAINGITSIDGATTSNSDWYIRLGDVSAAENGQRTVTLDTGILGTDQYNEKWALNPDLLPLRIELGCTIDDEDAGPTPYVYWGQQLVLTATLTEGWTGTDIKRFDRWEITRDSGDSDADNAWNHPTGAGSYRGLTDGQITLTHARGVGDDFNGAVAATFTVVAMGHPEEGSESQDLVVLKTAVINIHAETVERCELAITANIVGYNPMTQAYDPDSITLRIRATDQRGDVFEMTKGQIDNAGLEVRYAAVGSSGWRTLDFTGASDVVGTATLITATAFAAQQSINVRLVRIIDTDGGSSETELTQQTIAFVRDGEDSKVREWIFYRSTKAITFGTVQNPYPADVTGGEVNPSAIAGGSDSDKNQDGWVPEGWTDERLGADDTYRYEYSSYRDYVRGGDSSSSGDVGGWGPFSEPRVQSHWGADGKTSVRIDLDNPHEDFLYSDDSDNTLGGRVSGPVATQARLYDGGELVNTGVTWSIDPSLSYGVVLSDGQSPYFAWLDNSTPGLLHVEGIYAQSSFVTVKAVYGDNTYYAKFTANMCRQDKYSLVLTPNAVAYNSATYATQVVAVAVTRLDIGGAKSDVVFAAGGDDFYNPVKISATSGRGLLRLFVTYRKKSGDNVSQVTEQILSGTFSITAGADNVADLNDDIYFELRKYASADADNSSTYKIMDYDTVPITKADNGVDAQDVEWVYIRTMTNTAPTIKSDDTYTDTNGKTYTSDDHLPQVNGNANIENNENKYQCTDNPKGVTDIWKYEWEIKRTKGNAVNGKRSWNYYTGPMTLHNSVAESALIIDINNDGDQFGTDSTGKVLTQQARSTIVSMMYGTQEQAFAYQPSASLRYNDDSTNRVPNYVATVDVTPTVVGENMQYTVTVTIYATASDVTTMPFATHGGLYVDITGICAKGTKTIRFTLERVMSGAKGEDPVIYQLNPTSKDFVFNRLADNSLTPANRTTTVNALKTVGNTTTDATSADNLTFSWGFDDSATAEGSGAIGNSSSNIISVSNTQASSHYQVWVLLSTGDRETLPIVKDGTNGANGDNGKDAPYYKDTFARSTSNTHYTYNYIDRKYGTDGWGTTPPSSTDTYPYIWKRSQLWDPNTQDWARPSVLTYVCLTGAKGDNGEDAWVFTAEPANVIVTQNMVTTTNFTSATVSFSAKKGGTDATITSIGTPTWNHFTGTKSGNTITVSAPTTSGGEYYTEGYFKVVVNATATDGTTSSKEVTVLCYANLMGKFKTTIEGDVETSVAQKLTYGYDPDSQSVLPISTFGQYIRSSEVNISTLTTEVDGVVTDMSEIEQTSKKISLSVYGQDLNTDIVDGNLFDDPKFLHLDNKWTTRAVTLSSQGTNDNAVVFTETGIISTSNNYVLKIGQSVASKIESGKWYTMNFYAKIYGEVTCIRNTNTASRWVGVTAIWVAKGHRYNMTIYGYPASSSYPLSVRLGTTSTGGTIIAEGSISGGSSASPSSVTLSFDATETKKIYLQYKATSSNYGVYITKYSLNYGMCAMCFNGATIDVSEECYVDGKPIEATAKTANFICVDCGSVATQESSTQWVKHSITFKTVNPIGSSIQAGVAALPGNPIASIYHPLLIMGSQDEVGLLRTGIDIEKGKIKAVTDNFEIQNSRGDTTFSIDQEGNIIGSGNAEFAGIVKSKGIFYDFDFFDASNESKAYLWTFADGHIRKNAEYVAPSDYSETIDEGSVMTNCEYTGCGLLDVIYLRGGWPNGNCIYIPNPQELAGKQCEIYKGNTTSEFCIGTDPHVSYPYTFYKASISAGVIQSNYVRFSAAIIYVRLISDGQYWYIFEWRDQYGNNTSVIS